MKPKDYRIDEWNELINYFGGCVKFTKRIRFNETPHSKTEYIYEVKISDNFADYGYARDTIIQRLKWMKYLKEKV